MSGFEVLFLKVVMFTGFGIALGVLFLFRKNPDMSDELIALGVALPVLFAVWIALLLLESALRLGIGPWTIFLGGLGAWFAVTFTLPERRRRSRLRR